MGGEKYYKEAAEKIRGDITVLYTDFAVVTRLFVSVKTQNCTTKTRIIVNVCKL